MTSEEAITAVIEAFDALGVPYMLVGSFSSNYYGIPRSTQDADFVIQLKGISVGTLIERLGPQFQLEPQLSFEMIQASTFYVLRLTDNPFHIELFLLSDDEYDKERFNRRRYVSILGRETCIPTAEDVIVTKLRWLHHGRRMKDREDIQNVLAVQGDRLDWEYIQHWTTQHGTQELLVEIRKSIS